MPKVVCACGECKYNDAMNRCTAKSVRFSWHSVMTLYNGRQEYLKCKAYEMDDRSRELAEKLMEYMRKNPVDQLSKT